MALTQQQLDATRKYKAGEITSDQYKQAYVTNYDPTKDRTAGKNVKYAGNPVEEALNNQLKPVEPMTSSMVLAPQAPVQQQLQPQQPQNAQINNQFKSQTDSMVAELKNRIAQSVQKQKGLISSAPQNYDPMRSQSELTKGQELRSVLERNANLGDRGDIGRSAALQTQTEGENRLNSINMQQQNFIDTANQEIASLETQGLFEEASIVSSQRAKELQALLEQQRYDQERSDNQQRLSLEQSRYDQERTTEQSRYDYGVSQDTAQTETKNQDKVVQDFISTIGRFAKDYSSEVNRNKSDGNTSNDWQIPYLEQAKQDKVTSQGLDPRTGKPLPVDNTQQVWDAAYKKWNAGIPLTSQEMQAIGATSAVKPKPTSGGSSGGSRGSGSSGGGGSQITSTSVAASTPKQVISYAESQLRGSGGSTAADKLVNLNNTGVMDNLTPAEIKTLMNKFGVDEKMIEQAENRLESIATGVKLPSGRVTVPTNPNLLVR